MSFFSSLTGASSTVTAASSSASANQPDPWMNIIFIVVLFAVMYFFVIRPQSKRQKELKKMIDSLSIGDEVVVAGGILGRIHKMTDNLVELQIASSVHINVQRGSVSVVLPKGTLSF